MRAAPGAAGCPRLPRPGRVEAVLCALEPRADQAASKRGRLSQPRCRFGHEAVLAAAMRNRQLCARLRQLRVNAARRPPLWALPGPGYLRVTGRAHAARA